MNIPLSLVKWKFNEVYPKNSKTFNVGLTDRLTSMPVNLRLSPDRLMVIPLFVSDPPSDGTSNWMKSFSYWFPAKSFTVFALDGNDPQVCSRSQPARIGVVSVFHKFNWVLVWYQTGVVLGLRCGAKILNPTLTSVISTNLRTSLDPKGDLHLIWDVARLAWNHEDGGWAAVMVLP